MNLLAVFYEQSELVWLAVMICLATIGLVTAIALAVVFIYLKKHSRGETTEDKLSGIAVEEQPESAVEGSAKIIGRTAYTDSGEINVK